MNSPAVAERTGIVFALYFNESFFNRYYSYETQ